MAVDLFQLYRREPVSLRAMLFEAACHRASLYDLPYPISYENHVIQDIITNLSSPTSGTTLATCLLANVKRRSGESSSMHWRAAQKMIAVNGGLLSFRDEPLVFTKHTWAAIALSGTSNGFMDQPLHREGYEELKGLLLKRKSTTLKVLPTSQADEEQQNDYVRSKVFKTPTALKRLVKRTQESIEDHQKSPSVKASCRFAIIIFLTSAMQDYGDFSRAVESYLASVAEHLDQKSDDSALSPEHLL
ncbi:uncharacterized protein BDZ99DRAFT_504187 [Mytilinidion resinicola]|uniref:Uncharacterized protein n=1 Tax=Mytilinidion resinicola TaxID=574789 RepID=A0A6A6Y278_9PEZI|nr:uncharacterized protein BDZ99DRAFT_504187 [Mytilinidion resinicola]KAF2801917.1 hypothetical protein BDZ99DRAFT_504187 [Mytilinidion resinicola]